MEGLDALTNQILKLGWSTKLFIWEFYRFCSRKQTNRKIIDDADDIESNKCVIYTTTTAKFKIENVSEGVEISWAKQLERLY